MVKDMALLVVFWAIVMGPCLLALKTGLHRDEPYESR